MAGKPEYVCVGEITAAHGVRGLVRIRPFTETPEGVTAYGDPTDAKGDRRLSIDLKSWSKGAWIASIDGVGDRTAAEKMRGTLLYVPRDRLPPPEDDDAFYYHDLIGLSAVLPNGAEYGEVRGIADHGAGDIVEIRKSDGETVFIPFTRAAVPKVDVAGGWIVVDPPVMTGDEPEAASDSASGPGGPSGLDGEPG